MEALTLIPSHTWLERYRTKPERLQSMAVAFSGSPRSHINDPGRILLLSDPFSQQGFIYEFLLTDVLYAEEMANLSKADGSMVPMVRLWVKKGASALKLVPFLVQDTSQILSDFF